MSYRSILIAAAFAYSLTVPVLASAVPAGAKTRVQATQAAKSKAFATDKDSAASAGKSSGARAQTEAKKPARVADPAQKEAKKPARVADAAASGKPASKVEPAAKAKARASGKRAPAPCFSPEVHVVRKRGEEIEHRDLALTFCDGRPNPSALDSLSVLARPRDAERPLMSEIVAYRNRRASRGPAERRRRPGYLSEHVMRVHPGLLERLQKVAQHFKGKTIEVISGHRPDARETSRHHHGRALDFRVDGVSREALRDFIRKLDETGVGYYPNSYFVHMDVRDEKGYWVDRSGPGEAADYGPWPPSRRQVERDQQRVLANALSQLAGLGTPVASTRPSPKRTDVVRADDEPSDQALQTDEIAKIRAEALAAIQAL